MFVCSTGGEYTNDSGELKCQDDIIISKPEEEQFFTVSSSRPFNKNKIPEYALKESASSGICGLKTTSNCFFRGHEKGGNVAYTININEGINFTMTQFQASFNGVTDPFRVLVSYGDEETLELVCLVKIY